MTAYLLANHWLNLVAPAALMALLLPLLARVFIRFLTSNKAVRPVWWAQAAINFIVGVVVLMGGLVLFGHDGKMLTYVVLVLAMALSQWSQLGGWKR